MNLRSIVHVPHLSGKRVLVRVDFNVPIKGTKVLDDTKIRRSLPTIRFLHKKGAQIILVSHRGRPQSYSAALSLEPVKKHLEKLLRCTVDFKKIRNISDIKKLGSKSVALPKKRASLPTKGSITMLDNIRFVAGESTNDPKVAKALARLASIFVLDGFAVAHRQAASVSAVARYLPSYAGLLLFDEISVLTSVMKKPKRPLVVLLGGIKVETKIPVLKKLLSKADYILVGGGIATTLWWAQGKSVGGSMVGKEYKRQILRYCKNKKVITPIDVVVGDAKGKRAKVVNVGNLQTMKLGSEFGLYDIGPSTVQLYAHYIKQAKTLLWNGAMGMFEVHPYEYGTQALAHLFAARSHGKAVGIAGGGETTQVLENEGLTDDIDLVSTGGGAMLEFLAGKSLPGLRNLKKKFF